jgi:hypothetical protein
MSRTARFVFVLALGLLLTAPPTWAGAPANRHTAPSAFTRFWSLLTGLWADAGCIIDPHGCMSLPQPDEGCILDPHGCTSLPHPDEGCGIDPHGGCSPQG